MMQKRKTKQKKKCNIDVAISELREEIRNTDLGYARFNHIIYEYSGMGKPWDHFSVTQRPKPNQNANSSIVSFLFTTLVGELPTEHECR